MTAIDDILYSPIVPADELRDLVKRIMNNPTSRKILDTVSDHIVDLFGRHGIHDEQEIVDAVYRTIKEIEGNLIYTVVLCYGVIGPRIHERRLP